MLVLELALALDLALAQAVALVLEMEKNILEKSRKSQGILSVWKSGNHALAGGRVCLEGTPYHVTYPMWIPLSPWTDSSTGELYCFSMLLEEREMRTLEPRPQTLHGCHVLLKYLEETLGQVYSGCYSNVIGYHGHGDPLLAVYQQRLLDNRIRSDLHVYFYRPQRSWGKVMFSQACVILFTGGVSASCWDATLPRKQTPPGSRHPPDTPQGADTTPRADTSQKQTPPPPPEACWEIRSTRGRYASYWNAILFA